MVADTVQAGTPDPKATGTESGGTVAAGQDGSEGAAKPVDAGLLEAWKPKVEGYNKAVEERNAAYQRMAELEARLAATQQAANPLAQTFQNLQERAAYGDADAVAMLQMVTMTAAQQAELNLTQQMLASDVAPRLRNAAANLVRQSGYRMSFDQAAKLVQGEEVPDLQAKLAQREQELAALKAQMSGGAPKVNLSTVPAPVGDSGPVEMDPDEYAAIMRRGGAEAVALRDRGVKFRR